MGQIMLRLLPFLLLFLLLYILWQLFFKKATLKSLLDMPSTWYILAAIGISVLGGGLALFFLDDSPKKPHTYSPTKYIDGKLVPGHAE